MYLPHTKSSNLTKKIRGRRWSGLFPVISQKGIKRRNLPYYEFKNRNIVRKAEGINNYDDQSADLYLPV